jgi:hypothetical protein
MPTVQFLGKVLPQAVEFTLGQVPAVVWEAKELDLKMVFNFQVEKSNVRVTCDVNRYDDSLFVHVFMRALDLVRGAVDLVCFASGVGATVTLDTFINANGTSSLLLPQDKRLPAICTAFSLGARPDRDFGVVLNFVFSEPGLFMALNDLVTAITLPHQSPVVCARAIERLRHLIAPNLSTKDGWNSLRQSLQISEDYLKFITEHSAGPRHGDPQHVPGIITTEVTKRAWVVMNRFLEYRKRGSVALPISEFPMLTS